MNFKKYLTMGLVGFIAVMGIFAAAPGASAAGDDKPPVFEPLKGSLTKVDNPTGNNIVDVGLYGTNVYELSFADNTFYFSGYLWMRWNGDIVPTDTLEFVNAVETWGLMITPLTEEPEQLPNGDFVQTLSVQGRFYQTFPLGNYPLDSQNLTIMIEDTTNQADDIVYRADASKSGLATDFKIPGFDVKGLTAQSYVHDYATDFGYTGTINEQKYSALAFEIQVERSPNLFLFKLLLPLLLVLITNWLALILNPKYVEVRTAMPATALLTTVFLQLSSMEGIGQVAILVLMDKIYVVVFAAIVLTLAQIIWDNHGVKNEEDEATLTAIAKRDRKHLIVSAVITAGILLAMILPLL